MNHVAFSDFCASTKELIAECDTVIDLLMVHGTDKPSHRVIPSTGKWTMFRNLKMFPAAGGRIAEH